MLSSTELRNLSIDELKILIEKCEIPSCTSEIIKKFNVSISFSDNKQGYKFVTIDTRQQDDIWWRKNKNKNLEYWRESDTYIYNFTDYSDSSEKSLYMAAIRAIKPITCLKHIASQKNKKL